MWLNLEKGHYLKPILLFLISFIALINCINGQEKEMSERDLIRLMNDADGYFIYDENYKKAAQIYEILYEVFPDNHNLNYKLGVCYLNIKGKKKEALNLLNYASNNFVDDIRYSTIGSEAHFDVLFYLAYACQVNMLLEEAIKYYKDYQNQLRVREASEIEYIDLQIKGCRKAQEIDIDILTGDKELFAPWLGKFREAVNPVVSANDSVFIFTVQEDSGNRIYFSRIESDQWSEPDEITNDLGNHSDMFSNSITGDGKTLIIVRNNGFSGDIYSSEFRNSKWSKIKKLGKNINTKYWESHASISEDGRFIYYASNKPGGYGSLDIYMSERSVDGTFGPSRNLGPSINTILEENTPYYNMSSNLLYFSSTGHEGIGGYDIFYSEYNRRWSKPVHLPYPFNTTGDNLNYTPFSDNSRGLLSLTPTDTSSYSNIFVVTITGHEMQKSIIARGQVSLDDGPDINPDQLSVLLLNSQTDTVILEIIADSLGVFECDLIPGSYYFKVDYPGYSTDTLSINVSSTFEGEQISLTSSLLPESIERGEYLKVRTILFSFNSDELSRDAQIEIEKVLPILISNNDLQVELSGFADPVGPEEYNMSLSMRRAQRVKDYFIMSGIDVSRIVCTSYGETGFIAENKNPDGSDSVEGRSYNRRVSIGIINDGYSIPVESFRHIPVHLRSKLGYSFYVLMHRSQRPVPPGFFIGYGRSELAFVKEFETDGEFLYLMGKFVNRTDALDYLVTARESGFKQAEIISEYELPDSGSELAEAQKLTLFTIQIHALTSPATEPFPGIDRVREIKGKDGFYRYVVGEYRGYSKARSALGRIHDLGYHQAFIKEVGLLENQTLNQSDDL